MFFEAKLTVDPSQLTNIEKVKPKKAFKRMLFHLTSGKISDQEEVETFNAISILQQLNNVFLSNHIDNIIRLSHDDIDFYLDKEGKKNDLKDAFDTYDLEINESMSTVFNTLEMVLEHNYKNFNYLIEAKIVRSHEVGAYPIELKVKGFLSEFRTTLDDDDALKNRMKSIFSTKKNYDRYCVGKQSEFEAFVGQLNESIQKIIKVDDVKVDVSTKMILPKEKTNHRRRTKSYSNKQMPYTYYGFDDYLFYTLIWSDLCHSHSIPVSNINVVDEQNDTITSIGEEEVNTGDAELFNSDTDYDSRVDDFSGDGTDYHDTLSSDSGGSWFGGSDDSGGGFFDSSSSCSSSSCSSCSSCGGCGGCGS